MTQMTKIPPDTSNEAAGSEAQNSSSSAPNIETAAKDPSAPAPPKEKKQQEIARFTRNKPRKKKIIIGAAVLVAAALAVKTFAMPKDTSVPVSVSPLAAGELVNMVNVTGTVESANVSRIYSSQTGKVQEILVKVGDRVEKGDVLARLDTSDIELSIAKQKASMSESSQIDAIDLAAAEKEYNDMVADLQNGMYAPLVAAEQAIANTSQVLADARRKYNDNWEEIDYAEEQVTDLEKKLTLARRDKEDAAKECKKSAGHGLNHTDECLEAQKRYDEAFQEWKQSYNEFSTDISDYSKAVQDARLAYENALQDRDVAALAAERKLQTLRETIEKGQISAQSQADQLTLKSLINDLNESTLTAPISGTVTALYAKEGMPGNGLMAVIEDTDNLIVKTTVREYDIANVKEGMPAIIKSDSTKEQEFDARVERISPAAAKDADGTTKSDGNVEFETEVALLSKDSGLRVGMNVRLNIIIEKKENVFSVPFDAVITDPEGQNIVYAARFGEDGRGTAEPVPVTTGMETDFYIEVESESLQEGDQIITNPLGLTAGAEIKLMPQGMMMG